MSDEVSPKSSNIPFEVPFDLSWSKGDEGGKVNCFISGGLGYEGGYLFPYDTVIDPVSAANNRIPAGALVSASFPEGTEKPVEVSVTLKFTTDRKWSCDYMVLMEEGGFSFPVEYLSGGI